MNREEILKMSRIENKDEMKEQIRDKSFLVSTITLIIIAELFTYIRMINGEAVWDLCITEWSAISASFLYRFIKTKDKLNLVILLITGLMLSISIIFMVKDVVIF